MSFISQKGSKNNKPTNKLTNKQTNKHINKPSNNSWRIIRIEKNKNLPLIVPRGTMSMIKEMQKIKKNHLLLTLLLMGRFPCGLSTNTKGNRLTKATHR